MVNMTKHSSTKHLHRAVCSSLTKWEGSIPETLIILNSAIANRYFDFPIGKVEAHPDFRIVRRETLVEQAQTSNILVDSS